MKIEIEICGLKKIMFLLILVFNILGVKIEKF